MIAFIEGIVEEIGTSELIVNVNGIGYEVFTAHPERFEFAQSYRLYTYAVYREDNQQLYGFKELEQRNFFKLLVEKVNGVGPKLALTMLGFFPMQDLCTIVLMNDADALARCPGIGKKTAQRLILELQDHLKKGVSVKPVKTVVSSAHMDAVEALSVLGYARKQAENLIDAIKPHLNPDDTVETILKKVFSKPMR